MFKPHNPPDILPLVGPLSWGLEVPAPRRLLYVSGQVGADRAGRVGKGVLAQARLAWSNVGAVLRSAGLTPQHIVRTGIFFTKEIKMTAAQRDALNEIRVGFLGSHRPSSTIVFVHRLMDPRWLVEIEAVAVEL